MLVTTLSETMTKTYLNFLKTKVLPENIETERSLPEDEPHNQPSNFYASFSTPASPPLKKKSKK